MGYITINDNEYPNKLRKILEPPQILYYKGDLKLLKEPAIAIIGSRDISQYGKNVGRNFIKEIALRDIVVVSGMAKGADRLAHEETLNAGGKTIAVMGTGFNHIYPVENVDIYNRILAEGGLVITEFSNEVEFKSSNFPYRNRIISGLSNAVLILEAKYRSGTSITANYAWNQGKEVYALPRKIR